MKMMPSLGFDSLRHVFVSVGTDTTLVLFVAFNALKRLRSPPSVKEG